MPNRVKTEILNGNEIVLSLFIDYITLLYHEARYIAILKNSEMAKDDKWSKIKKIPPGRYQAFKELRKTYDLAHHAHTSMEIQQVFYRHYHVTLDDIKDLFEQPEWEKSQRRVGGNAWARITDLVINLGKHITENDQLATETVLTKLKNVSHNTNKLEIKRQQLHDCYFDQRKNTY